MKDLKILAVIDDKNSELVEKCLEKLSNKFGGKVYLVYVRDVDYYPAEVLLEVEKTYDKIRDEGLTILNDIAEKVKQLGFDTEILGVYCGISSERLVSVYKSIDPDILVDLRVST
jgi:nucleotide-binding universal stress UspA family protein